MNEIYIRPRGKNERGIYAIYPKSAINADLFKTGRIDQGQELCRVKARTPSEAIKFAETRGVVQPGQAVAIEVVAEERVQPKTT